MAIRTGRRRPGRPTGPSPSRGPRPWDPYYLRQREVLALDYIAEHPDEPRWLIAQRFGMSLSRLSVISCSPLGQAYLAARGLPPNQPKVT